MQVNILEARNQLPQLIKSALAGETVVIANRGIPVVRLVPVAQPSEEATPGSPASFWSVVDSLGRARVRRSSEELDAEVEAERASWD